MNRSQVRIALCCLFLFFAAVIQAVADGKQISLSGFVRDSHGKPLTGVQVVLSSHQTPSRLYQAPTGASGAFRFTGLDSGTYTLTGELTGYKVANPLVIFLNDTSVQSAPDLVMTPAASPAGAEAHKAMPNAPLEFQPSGIRGIIDPGGYSASTDGAASGLLRGIADLKRADPVTAGSPARAWPCSLEPALRHAVADHPDHAESNRRLGQFYASHDRIAEAIPLLKRALDADPNDDASALALATAWLGMGEFQQARSLLIPIARRSSWPEPHQLLAQANEGFGMFQEAAQEYRIADREHPSEQNIFGIGYELILATSVADAIVAFQDGIARYPRSIPLRMGVGSAQFLLSNPSAALDSFLDATSISPSDRRPYPLLVKALGISGGQRPRVLERVKQFWERSPNDAEANYLYAVVLYQETGADPVHTEMLLKRAIALNPDIADAHLLLGNLYARRSDDQAAILEYQAAVRQDRSLAEAHYRLALAYRRTGRSDQSAREMQMFRNSKARPPGDPVSGGDDGMSLKQFISVTDLSSVSVQDTQCDDAKGEK